MSDNCPHQFVPTSKKKLRNHMGGWQGLCPKAFHLFVKSKVQFGDEVIYNEFLASQQIKDIAVYGVTKEKVMEYIAEIKPKYQ